MSDTTRWMNEVGSIRQMRDELQLKAHLLRADLRGELERLEHDLVRLERDLHPIGTAIGTTAKELANETQVLLKDVQAGYVRIRDAVRAAV
jgi:hypothetical protein